MDTETDDDIRSISSIDVAVEDGKIRLSIGMPKDTVVLRFGKATSERLISALQKAVQCL